jgi:hypothetical protein
VSASGVYNTTLVAALVAYFLALYYFRISNSTERLDFHDFGDIYTWAYAARIGLNPYAPDGVIPLAKQLGFQAMTANYPPPFVLAIEPLSLLPLVQVFWLWSGINLCLLLIAVWLLVADLEDSQKRVSFACAALVYGPVTDTLLWGQIEPFILLMLVLALRWSAARRDILCGIAVGLAALCKIYPIALLGYFLLYRRWTIVAAAGLIVLGGILLSLLAFSGEVNAEFIRQLLRTAGDKFWPYTLNVSPGAVVAKTLWLLAGHNYNSAVKVLRTALIVLVTSVVLAMTIRGTLSAKRRDEDNIGFGLWVIAALLLTPTIWPHSLTILLIPLRQVTGDIRYKTEVAFRLGIYSYCSSELGLLLGWLGWRLWPLYVFLMQFATACTTLLVVLLVFGAAYALAIGGLTDVLQLWRGWLVV